MKKPQSEIVIYQTKDGQSKIDVRLENGTIWLTQNAIADLFQTTKQNIGQHTSKIFSEGELKKNSTVKKFFTVQKEGSRNVERNLEHYNLDAIISVGYRVKSSIATQFRIWATSVLKEHLTQGWTINRQRFEENSRELETALELVRKASKSPELNFDSSRGLVDVIARYAQTFLLLQRYDEGLLAEPRAKKGGELLSVKEARNSLADLKKDLISRKEATALFAKERSDGLASILGNLEQTVFGKPAYPTIESKAAHLLYFVIKNHPFVDGNKRSAAFLFVDFLNRNHRLLGKNNQPIINEIGLAALTLLIAESDPKNKEIMIKLVINMLVIES
ncbi:MAG: virulence RhuM family protein [Proteobacteria bacterium]|nr:virulence RhuM family protein [Pseudomonadota bacterium]